jgi:hypothetical protein
MHTAITSVCVLLCRWYAGELPKAISSRAPEPHITQPELVQLVRWVECCRRGGGSGQVVVWVGGEEEGMVNCLSPTSHSLSLCSW